MRRRLMTHEEVVEVVRAKERALGYIQENMGIWGMPFSSERDALKYWREVLAGRMPRPMVDVPDDDPECEHGYAKGCCRACDPDGR